MRLSVVVVMVCLLKDATSAVRKETNRKKDRLKSSVRNPCSIEEHDAPMHCFCDGGGGPANATSAECWIFSNKLTPDYAVWNYFSRQPRITTMKMLVRPNGNFSFVPTKALSYLTELRTFEITYAQIDEVHQFAFANLSQLKELKLTRNQIVTLAPRAFDNLPNLTELNLDENRIAELPRDVFGITPSPLQRLFITQNNLSVIQEKAFTFCTKLVELELSTNYLSVLTTDTFAGLSEVKRLDLSHNKIAMLGELTFAELWVVEELLLESNQIELIATTAFNGLSHLKRLTLSHNRLTNLSPTLLVPVPDIIHLDLRSNNLETLTFENIKPILVNLYLNNSYFYIESNHLICDCRLAWMHQLRNRTNNERIRNVLDELICYLDHDDPNLHQGIQNLRAGDDNTFPEGEDFDVPYDDYNYDHQQDSTSDHTDRPPHDPSMRHLFEIPVAELPCPHKEVPTEETLRRNLFNTPSYAEINSGCSSTTVLSIVLLLTTTFGMYLT